jgi:tubulin-specific chaperone B
VKDTRPASMQTNFNDVSAVEKYVMPATEYETRSDSVLTWKKTQKLGRFDPNAPTLEEQKIRAIEREIDERGVFVILPIPLSLLPALESKKSFVAVLLPFAHRISPSF